MHPIYMTPIGVPTTTLNIESITLVGFIPSRKWNHSLRHRHAILAHQWFCSDPSIKKYLSDNEKKSFAHWKRQQMCNIYQHIISDLYRYFKCGKPNESTCWRSYADMCLWYHRLGVRVKTKDGRETLIHPLILTVSLSCFGCISKMNHCCC
jgi:hypothetical protein